ncbi:MAG: DNA polymerase III subunit delta [Clostridia bacterium]|nr:DNA polymerase III subunit delta [Clostridia bacterium]
MTWQELFDEIKNGYLGGAYLFHGPEEYIKKSAMDKIREAILPAGLEILNETVMDAPNARQLIESAETLPVMAEKRLIVIKDTPLLTGAKAKDEQDENEKIEKWLSNGAPDTAVIIFYVRGDADKRKKLYKTLEKHAKVVSFQYLTDPEISKWIQSRLKPKKKTMKQDAVSTLLFYAGRDLTRLSGEVDKLAAYVGEAATIEEKDVKTAVTPSAESNVFLMIDSLVASKAKTAYEILNAMLDAGESPVTILAMLIRQLRLMTHVRLLRDENLSLPEIEKKTKLTNFVAKKVYGQTNKLSAKRLEEGYRAGVQMDFDVKSGKIRERAALDRMMLMLIEISQ